MSFSTRKDRCLSDVYGGSTPRPRTRPGALQTLAHRARSTLGQATIEAAVLLPVLFSMFGLFLQPALLLYDSAVMNAAAAEGCRLLATNTAHASSVRAYVRRRLGAVPKTEVFHCGKARGWTITWKGSEATAQVKVSIEHRVRPLPLLGITAGLADSIDSDGLIVQKVEASSALVPGWVGELGENPSDWIEEWE